MKTVRSFLALNLELETIRQIAKAQDEIIERAKAKGARINFVPPQNMHLTIRFLGNITEPMIQVIKDGAEQITRATAPFKVDSRNVGFFPDQDNPKVIYAAVEESSELMDFHDRVCGFLEDTGFKEKGNSFKSHVTIGRVKEATSDQVREMTAGLEEKEFGQSTIKDLICYRSDLSKKGVDYSLLWKLSLQGRIQVQQGKLDSATESDEVAKKRQGEQTKEHIQT